MPARTDRVDYDLTPEPASVRRARQAVCEQLERWGLEALSDNVALCVSELVTNAVLHAGTALHMAVIRMGDGVRVEVDDGRPELPVPVPRVGSAADITAEGMTGRGLHVVESFAAAWGVDPRGPGKVVWFEVGTPAPGPGDDTVGAVAPPADVPVRRGGEPAVGVRLLSMPVRAAVASGRHVDDLVREVQMALAGGGDRIPPGLAVTLRSALDRSAPGRLAGRRAAHAAAARGERRFDLPLVLPSEVLAGVAELNRVIEQASALVRPELVTPSEEVRAFRGWVVEEVGRQLAGGDPVPCPLPD